MYERASGPRQRRSVAGERMVTPARPVIVTYNDGSEERLLPDRQRFDPSHPLVRERPELFRLCMSKGDRTNAPARWRDALRAALRDEERILEGTGPPSGTSHSRPRTSFEPQPNGCGPPPFLGRGCAGRPGWWSPVRPSPAAAPTANETRSRHWLIPD